MTEPKGTRDYEPDVAAKKEHIVEQITSVLDSFGYVPIDTPVIESREILTSKFTGGEEILKEMYSLTDQGKRKLGLRYDLTVPFGRFMAEHPEYKMPFRRRQVGKVFRDGPVKAGRYREFHQYDFDIVGEEGPEAEAELLAIIRTVLENLDLNPTIQVNSRDVLTAVISAQDIQIPVNSAILTLDKIEKKGREGVIEELKDKGVAEEKTLSLIETLSVSGTNEEKLEALKSFGTFDTLQTLVTLTESYGCEWTFNPFLARGLTYYTGTVFEAFDKSSGVTSSLSAGGRYDSMIGNLASYEAVAVGGSFGVDTLLDATETTRGVHDTDLFVIPLAPLPKIIEIVQTLRKEGINVVIGSSSKHFRKNLDYADKEGFGYLLVIGDEEITSGEYEVKDLQTGDTKQGTLEEIPQHIHTGF